VKQHDQPTKGKAADETPAKDKVAKDKDKVAKDKTAKSKKSDDNSSDGDEGVDGDSPNKKEKQLANFQRQRDKKISQAEHLRQIAERNGNANLAANADRMEAQARDEYAKKVSHLEKFGVTDPELNPDGVDPTNPLVPDTGPLSDPLSTLRGLLPFGR
jgi:hypothetical protein